MVKVMLPYQVGEGCLQWGVGVVWLAGYFIQCWVGGFNVSNLMGIKRRMIDFGKKITFYFLQNV
jgi:hypothetical protein